MLLCFFVIGSLFTVLAELLEFNAILQCLLVLLGSIVQVVTLSALKRNEIVLRHNVSS